MSITRKKYVFRLIMRIIILIAVAATYFIAPEQFEILDGMNFFQKFSPFHLLWIVWILGMFQQIVPIKNKLPLGSMKLFANRFRPIRDRVNYQALREYIINITKAAYKIFLIWVVGILCVGLLYWNGLVDKGLLLVLSVVFYVCDLICVLIWCPFRLMMRTRCCTTCRIFNWDHLMMFSHLMLIGGFYAVSLVSMAFLAWLVWEICIMLYPERFWDKSNLALKCSECTDKLCSQYCQKIRPKKS